MGNSPIQVVLNTNNFIEEVENKGGGPSTDFFADNDVAFIEHRELLTQQLREIKKLQIDNEFAPVSYAKNHFKTICSGKKPLSNSCYF